MGAFVRGEQLVQAGQDDDLEVDGDEAPLERFFPRPRTRKERSDAGAEGRTSMGSSGGDPTAVERERASGAQRAVAGGGER